MKAFIYRGQAPLKPLGWLKAGIGATIAIALVCWLGIFSGVPFVLAPFGASCTLLFALPASPLSQPANVIAGHLLSTAVGLACHALLPGEWWCVSLAVGLAIALMAALRITHPPAGADPLVVFAASPGWAFLLFPVLAGSLALVATAILVHRLPPRTRFPATGP